MSGAPVYLDAESLRAATFVRHVELHDSLPSTNDRAIQLAASPELETPALVAARLQTAGRGRGKNSWWSADGALTFSLVLDPAALGIGTANWPQLSLATAVAVCDALADDLKAADQNAEASWMVTNPQSAIRNPKSSLGIKWPNDIILGGRKVCGILIESPGGTTPAKDRLIIGVGINVNNSWREAPPEMAAAGAALCDFTGQHHDLQHVLYDFLRGCERRLTQLAANDSALPQAWQQRSWLTEQDVAVTVDGHWTEGHCIGIADDGSLLVKTLLATERIHSGSVQVLPT